MRKVIHKRLIVFGLLVDRRAMEATVDPPEVSAIFAGYEPNGPTVEVGEDLSWLDDGASVPGTPSHARTNTRPASAAADDMNTPQEPRDESGSPNRNGAAGVAGTLSVSDLERLLQILKGRESSGEPKLRLHKMPMSGDRALPNAKQWKQWYDVRFMSWAGAQAAGFGEAADAYMKSGDSTALDSFERENRILGYEVANMVDDKLLLYLLRVDKKNGMEMLRTLYKAINSTTSERTAALHERFSKPTPCKAKGNLAVALRQWQEDLQELQAVDSPLAKRRFLRA